MEKNDKLPIGDYRRYGRQMILDGFGLEGQLKLQQASVLVVGAGGLGCPALQYLAAAGIGRIGIVDHDIVETSNLQRQILHNEGTVGMSKVESAAQAITRLNSRVKVDTFTQALSPSNAASIFQNYDIILDCTDNPPTRYLISDTAVFVGKPLVSGAAQKYHGQLCTYNLGKDGLCYRCVFPRPPTQGGTCEETGILGAVTGVIGNLQALEAIKIITGLNDPEPNLLVFNALATTPFRRINLGSRSPNCPACGEEGKKIGKISEFDYVQFCGGKAPDWEQKGLEEGAPGCRIRALELSRLMEKSTLTIIDVRPSTEFGICNLPRSIHVLLPDLLANPAVYFPQEPMTEIYIVCRLGNDSQIAAEALRDLRRASSGFEAVIIKDVIGGLRAWAKEVDASFPIY
ncbi:Urmylation protein [Serendipita sp. 401]|nr:Urmylation protein [Serendipita sp. 401]KAG9051747.1 Urmylation protein [Serendipita sp. 407]